MFEIYSQLAERALTGAPPAREQALWMLDGPDVELLPLLHAAYVPRFEHFGRGVAVQVLNNVQNGLCPEDCGYCAQSKDSTAAIRKYPMKSDEEIIADAERHAGWRSAMPEERVRLRAKPCSAGTVKISPRASNTARLPEGETS